MHENFSMKDRPSCKTEVLPVAFAGLMGSIHRPLFEPRWGMTIVICSPVGRDACWTYRSLFLWAETLASRGFQVLRYDHRGEGDSQDIDPSADQWTHWLAGLKDAAAFARVQTGAQGLVLAGLR